MPHYKYFQHVSRGIKIIGGTRTLKNRYHRVIQTAAIRPVGGRHPRAGGRSLTWTGSRSDPKPICSHLQSRDRRGEPRGMFMVGGITSAEGCQRCAPLVITELFQDCAPCGLFLRLARCFAQTWQRPSPSRLRCAKHGNPRCQLCAKFGFRSLPYPAKPRSSLSRRGAGAVDRGGLENRCTLMGTQGSNPCLSAIMTWFAASFGQPSAPGHLNHPR